MAKQTQLDKAIAQIDGEIKVLQMARERLVQARAKAPVRKPRLKAVQAG